MHRLRASRRSPDRTAKGQDLHGRSDSTARRRARRTTAALRSTPMQASAFEEVEFFRAVVESPARALLIGRRGLIALGMPVMTRDYDFWIPADDAWARRIYLKIGDVGVPIPCIDDYILTKRFGARPRDADDIRWLERFRSNQP